MSYGTTDRKDTFANIMNKSGRFSDNQNITGVKFIDKDFHKAKKNLWNYTALKFRQRILFILRWIRYV